MSKCRARAQPPPGRPLSPPQPSPPTPSTRSRCRLRDGTLTIGSAEVVRAPKACTCLAKGSHIKGAAEDKGGQTSGSTLMSQKWPSRGPKRTFLPLRGLSKEWAFHCKGGSARKNEPRFFGVFTLSYLFAAPFQIQSPWVFRWGVDFIPMKFLWRTELPFARGRGPVWRGAGGRVPYRLRVVPRPSGAFSGGPPVCRHQTPSNGRGRPSWG